MCKKKGSKAHRGGVAPLHPLPGKHRGFSVWGLLCLGALEERSCCRGTPGREHPPEALPGSVLRCVRPARAACCRLRERASLPPFTSTASLKRNPILSVEASQESPVKDWQAPTQHFPPLPCFLPQRPLNARSCGAARRSGESHLDAQCIFHFPWGSNQKNL